MKVKSLLNAVCCAGVVAGMLGCSNYSERSQRLDACYRKYQCNASSWISTALGGTKVCNQCNKEFLLDKELAKPDRGQTEE